MLREKRSHTTFSLKMISILTLECAVWGQDAHPRGVTDPESPQQGRAATHPCPKGEMK